MTHSADSSPRQARNWRLSWLNPDGRKLLITRVLRSFGYGYLAVVLAIYLQTIGLNDVQIGALLTSALVGSAAMNVFWSLKADVFGRRRTVAIMSVLMIVGGLLFAAVGGVLLFIPIGLLRHDAGDDGFSEVLGALVRGAEVLSKHLRK